MLQDLVTTQESTLGRLEADCADARRESESQEISLAEAQRKLKEAIEAKQRANELNQMDLKNLKTNAERLAMERMQQAQQLEREKEQLNEQIQGQ